MAQKLLIGILVVIKFNTKFDYDREKRTKIAWRLQFGGWRHLWLGAVIVLLYGARSQTEKTAAVRRTAVREASVFQHLGGQFEGPLKPPLPYSNIVLRSLKGAHNCFPIMPRDASLWAFILSVLCYRRVFATRFLTRTTGPHFCSPGHNHQGTLSPGTPNRTNVRHHIIVWINFNLLLLH